MKDIEVIDPDMIDAIYGDEITEAPVSDMEAAEVAVHRILAIQERAVAAEEHAKAMKAKVDAWLAEQKRDVEGDINRAMVSLLPWVRLELQDRRKRSVDLVSGTVGFKRVQGKSIDSDKNATIEWYRENWPDYVRAETVYKLDTKNAKEFYRETGECAPTIEFEEPYDKPYVEMPK